MNDTERLPTVRYSPRRPVTVKENAQRLPSPTSTLEIPAIASPPEALEPMRRSRVVPLLMTARRPHTTAPPARSPREALLPGYTGFRPGKLCQENVARPDDPLVEDMMTDVSVNLSAGLVGGFDAGRTPRETTSQLAHGTWRATSPRVDPGVHYNKSLGTIPGYGNFSNFADWASGNGRRTQGFHGGISLC
jgi:hypothetical protein